MSTTSYRVLAVPDPGTTFQFRRAFGPLALIALLVAWWIALGPSRLGGPATFTIVDGRSMEPTYDYGDFVVARRQSSYEIGDVVVFPATSGRMIIHRIVAGNRDVGWTTRGDNNDRDDSWVLPDEAILGSKWFSVSNVGHAMLWTQRNPWFFAGSIGTLVFALSFVSGRFRRFHPILAAGIRHGRAVRLLDDRHLWEVALAFSSGLAAIASLVSLAILWSSDLVYSLASLSVVPVLAISAVAFRLVSRRIFDGHGHSDPQHSKILLSEDCKIVDELPMLRKYLDYSSARHLHRFILASHLPLLRHEHPDGSVTFLTITKRGVGHRWIAPAADASVAALPSE